MFAELISFLFPTALDGTPSIIQTPKTVADCQQNLSRVFAAISKLELSHGQTLKRLLTDKTIQSILRGERAVLNQFIVALYHVSKPITDIRPLAQPVEIKTMPRSNSSLAMPQIKLLNYTPEEVKQLDESTVRWLDQLGILSQLGISNAKSIAELETILRNGVLLCSLVEKVFAVKLLGVFKNPKTESTC